MQFCHDCGVKEGELHIHGCDMEICPFCGGQETSCDCCYAYLEIDCSPGTWAYQNGLTWEQEDIWNMKLEEKGRWPYICYPNFCARCGERSPEMFHVEDAEWERVVQHTERDKILCWSCFCFIRDAVNKTRPKERG